MKQVKPDMIVDIRGSIAPITLLKVEEILSSMVAGQVMDVVGDDEETRVDLASIVTNSGHEILSVSDQVESFRILIRKGPDRSEQAGGECVEMAWKDQKKSGDGYPGDDDTGVPLRLGL